LRKLLVAALFCLAATAASAESFAERMSVCLSCHGENGRSETPDVPSLGAQPAPFVLIQLYQFREKQRIAEPMNSLTAGFTDDDLREVSDFIAKLPPPAPQEPADAPRMAAAAEIAAKHRCGFCHNADYSGHDHIPRLGGQREDYLLKATTEYKSGARTGYDPAMVDVAKGLSDPEIAELAYYLARFR